MSRITSYAALLSRLLLGVTFVYSGFLKAVHPAEEFAAVVESYRILPVHLLMPFAKTFPWMELILGTYVVVGYYTRLSALGLAGLSAIFLAALSSARFHGIDLGTCGCFGGAGFSLTPVQAMGLDAGLLALAILVLAQKDHWLAWDHWISPPSGR